MRIVEYEKKYKEDVKNLLVELQEYIASIDREGYNILTDEFRDSYFAKTMAEVGKYEGKIFLAIDSNKVKGLIIGLINNDDEETYDFKAPKRGRVTELVVNKDCRGKGIGKSLMQEIEDYFRSVGCKGILIDVFAYNENAYKLYKRLGYFDRSIEMMKKID